MLKHYLIIVFLIVYFIIFTKISHASSFLVTTTDDSGSGSLRQAITNSNAAPGLDTIAFNISPDTPQTIQLVEPLPLITDPVIIDGWSQTGQEKKVSIEIKGNDHIERIISFGTNSDGSEIRGCAINSSAKNGIEVMNTSHISIYGNYIGADITGIQARRNQGYGIFVRKSNVMIGGQEKHEKNVISANHEGGIFIENSFALSTGAPEFNNIKIIGNIIGLSATGQWLGDPERDAKQMNGIKIHDSSQIIIDKNTISGNYKDSIHLESAAAVKIINNNIGLNTDGVDYYPNGSHGIYIASPDVWVGGEFDEGNNIVNNFGNGISVATNSRNVNILINTIFKNKGLAIDLDDNGVSLNDESDMDAGANGLLNFPDIISATLVGYHLNIILRLDIDRPSALVRFFTNPSGISSSGYGNAELFLGQAEVLRSPNTDQTVNLELAQDFDFTKLKNISATTTVRGIFGPGTSEFSKSVQAILPIDFGDAPDSSKETAAEDYQTVSSDKGAYHVFDNTLYLGRCVDADSGYAQNKNADADDQSLTTPQAGICAAANNDEDGISLLTPIIAGKINKMKVLTKGDGLLAVWIDLNHDGDFLDTQENVVYVGVNEGTHNINFFVPSNVFGRKYLRARLIPYGEDISPIGSMIGGEVEDYPVTIYPSDALEKTEAFKRKWLPNSKTPKK